MCTRQKVLLFNWMNAIKSHYIMNSNPVSGMGVYTFCSPSITRTSFIRADSYASLILESQYYNLFVASQRVESVFTEFYPYCSLHQLVSQEVTILNLLTLDALRHLR